MVDQNERNKVGLMKKIAKSLWFRLVVCAVCGVVFIAVPGFIVHNTMSNGLGAGVSLITMLGGLPFSSLICGFLSAPEAKKLWWLPALPSAVYFLFFPVFTDASLFYFLAQFSGLFFGYGAFVLGRYIS